ncbi:MAG: metallophosphoesterase family protein [Nitrososphaerota archaeon]
MKVAVLSDTHDNLVKLRSALSLARERGVEAVVHLGDFTSPFTLRELSGAAPRVVAVLGNNDGDPLMLHSVASRSGIELAHWPHELELGGRRLLLVHGLRLGGHARQGSGGPRGLGQVGRGSLRPHAQN